MAKPVMTSFLKSHDKLRLRLNNQHMIKFISGLCLILAAGILVYIKTPLQYYSTPKQERLYQLWKKDFEKLKQDPKFAKVFVNLSKVEVHFSDPQVAEEFEEFRTPFKESINTGYVLRINITRWIEKREYGFVIQHELFDQTDDKIYEFGRTYKVGLIF